MVWGTLRNSRNGVMQDAYRVNAGAAQEYELFILRPLYFDLTALAGVFPQTKVHGWVPSLDVKVKLLRIIERTGVTRGGATFDAAQANKTAEHLLEVPSPPVRLPSIFLSR